MKKYIITTATLCSLVLYAPDLKSADWSTNEIHLQYGNLKNPFNKTDNQTTIITLQHASGWKYGDNFFFIDFIDDNNEDGFNDKDYYGEFYANFSAGKITNKNLKYGIFKDAGFIVGLNAAGDSNSLKYLPGLRLSWDIPGFAFLNTDITAYIDDSASTAAEDNSYMIDINWARPFTIGNQRFSIGGHAEYIGERDKNTGGKAEGHFLAQPQFRWDVGDKLFKSKDHFFIGIEYQYWNNKLGTKEDENVIQALAVIRL